MSKLNNKAVKGVLTLLVIGAAALGLIELPQTSTADASKSTHALTSNTDAELGRAFEQRRNDLQIKGKGRVVRILSDDNKGSRHQRFILELGTGQRLLVAHNIDLADRVANLKNGDTVVFYGEYEWNERGGVIHWTHHDPGGRHIDGYLEHKGKRYQ